jgi:hypothetical protein
LATAPSRIPCVWLIADNHRNKARALYHQPGRSRSRMIRTRCRRAGRSGVRFNGREKFYGSGLSGLTPRDRANSARGTLTKSQSCGILIMGGGRRCAERRSGERRSQRCALGAFAPCGRDGRRGQARVFHRGRRGHSGADGFR